jgi:CRP-like cAMP-binding protein
MSPKQTNRPNRAHVDCLTVLRRHPIFGKLAPKHLKRLCALSSPRTVAADSVISARGDSATALFAICAGTVKITNPLIESREDGFNLLHAGEIFGEFALLGGEPRTNDAVAMTDCKLAVIMRRDFLRFVRGEPKVAIKLIELLCGQLSSANLRLEEADSLSVPTRLARTVLRLLDESSTGNGKLTIKQYELARIVRASRETVNKHLRAWAKRKWVRPERAGIVLLDSSALAAIARGVAGDGRRSTARRARRR